jgi:hypothetical protein
MTVDRMDGLGADAREVDRLRDEMAAAALWAEQLGQMGLRIVFERIPETRRLEIQVRTTSDRFLTLLEPRELTDLVGCDRAELERWAAGLGRSGGVSGSST